MSSAHVMVLVLLAVLHSFVQAGSVKSSETTTKPEVEQPKLDAQTGSDEQVKTSSENLSGLLAQYVKELDNYYNSAKSQRSTRTKRWADYDKRPGYYNSYSYTPPRSYSRFRYPSNLMALLRGTKRGWSDQPAPRWQYPSNLMVLLRGKKSAGEEHIVDEEEVDPDDDMGQLEQEAMEEIMNRLVDGWKNYNDKYGPGVPEKKSAFYGYDGQGGSSISRRPFGARQFLVWNGGRYILG